MTSHPITTPAKDAAEAIYGPYPRGTFHDQIVEGIADEVQQAIDTATTELVKELAELREELAELRTCYAMSLELNHQCDLQSDAFAKEAEQLLAERDRLRAEVEELKEAWLRK